MTIIIIIEIIIIIIIIIINPKVHFNEKMLNNEFYSNDVNGVEANREGVASGRCHVEQQRRRRPS